MTRLLSFQIDCVTLLFMNCVTLLLGLSVESKPVMGLSGKDGKQQLNLFAEPSYQSSLISKK